VFLDVGESWIVGVSFRKHRREVTPLDGEHGIVPKNAVFVGGSVIITAFVKKLNGFGHGEKTVRESNGDIDLILLLGAEMDARPLAEMRRADTDVGDNVQGFALYYATELGLRVLELIMKAAKRTAGRDGVIVLKEGLFDAEVYELCVMVGFEERTARVAMDYGT
jgi:hypothetical protein